MPRLVFSTIVHSLFWINVPSLSVFHFPHVTRFLSRVPSFPSGCFTAVCVLNLFTCVYSHPLTRVFPSVPTRPAI